MNVEEKINEFIEGNKDFNVHINNVDLLKEYLKNIGITKYYTMKSEWWVRFSTLERRNYELSNSSVSGKEIIEWLEQKNKACKKEELLDKKKSLEKEIILLDIQLKNI